MLNAFAVRALLSSGTGAGLMCILVTLHCHVSAFSALHTPDGHQSFCVPRCGAACVLGHEVVDCWRLEQQQMHPLLKLAAQ